MKTVLLLTCSNIFMTLAWYGHLKFKDQPLWIAIAASWGIALLEYIFQVPANQWKPVYEDFWLMNDPEGNEFCLCWPLLPVG